MKSFKKNRFDRRIAEQRVKAVEAEMERKFHRALDKIKISMEYDPEGLFVGVTLLAVAVVAIVRATLFAMTGI